MSLRWGGKACVIDPSRAGGGQVHPFWNSIVRLFERTDFYPRPGRPKSPPAKSPSSRYGSGKDLIPIGPNHSLENKRCILEACAQRAGNDRPFTSSPAP